MDRFEENLASTGALADGLRRRMYLFIREQRRPVSRDEAAEAVGISRKLAAFHLDKLVEKGLLQAHYERLTGRTGPGAGRPAKVYEPSEEVVSVSIPHRSYEVVGDILLDAVEGTSGAGSARSAALAAAYERGGQLVSDEARGRAVGNKQGALELVRDILSERGYEPYLDEPGTLNLHNCPFHGLAQRSPELICEINKAFIEGLLAGIKGQTLEAFLEPLPGECCVHVRAKEKNL